MTTAPPALARCVIRGCPWRWRAGPDRRCPHHDGDDHGLAERMTDLGITDTPGETRAASTEGGRRTGGA